MSKSARLVGVGVFLISIVSAAQTPTGMYRCHINRGFFKEKMMKSLPYENEVNNTELNVVENKVFATGNKSNRNTVNKFQKAVVDIDCQAQILGFPISFGVKGKCNMCKNKIERAARLVAGVSSASWSANKMELNIILSNDSIEILQIHKAIAELGYDTDQLKAEDKAYNTLDYCCRYDR